MRGKHTPTYSLAEMQGALRAGRYWITRSALDGASSAGGHAVVIFFKRDESA